MRLTAAVTREGDWYFARCLEVEVTSQGHTLEEAITNLQKALELYCEDLSPYDIPLSPIIAPLDIDINGITPFSIDYE